MPNSLRRDAERASRRLVTLAHAISRTSPQAAPRMASGDAKMLDAPVLRLPDRYDPGADPLVGLRKGACKARGNRRRFGVCLGDADAGFEPDDGLEVPRIALAFAGQWHWYPAVQRDPRKIAVKFRRRHADDGDLVPVNAHGAAENGRVAPEILLPQPVADDRRERFGPVAIFVASERAAQDWLYAQDVEVVSGDQFEPRGIGASLRRRSRRDLVGSAAIRRCFGGCPGSPGSRHRKRSDPGCRWRRRIPGRRVVRRPWHRGTGAGPSHRSSQRRSWWRQYRAPR